HTRSKRDWSSDVCSSDLTAAEGGVAVAPHERRGDPYPAGRALGRRERQSAIPPQSAGDRAVVHHLAVKPLEHRRRHPHATAEEPVDTRATRGEHPLRHERQLEETHV